MNNERSLFKTLMQVVKLLIRLFIAFCKIIPIAFSKLHKWLVKRIRFSITFKITTVYAAIFTLILLLFNAGISVAFIAYLGKNAEDNLMKDFQIISSYLRDSTEFPTGNIKHLSELDRVDITVFTEGNKLIYTTVKDNVFPVVYDKNNSNNVLSINDNYYFILNSSKLYYDSNTSYNNKANSSGFALVLNDNMIWKSSNIYIQITNHLSRETFGVGLLIAALFSITIIVIIIIIVIGSRASKKMLKPVEKMTSTVKNITINALDTRLDVGGSQDELKELAETFNSMLDRIQLSYEQQNQFVSDASHELRTPISVIQGYANLLDRWGKNDQLVLEESIESIKTEAENMKDLIEKLLFLARGDKEKQRIDNERFSINELIDEVIKETKLIDHSHEITTQRYESIFIYADRKLLKEALRSFIDNSIKYTPEGGKIIIDCYSQKYQAVITIKDTGMGIPKEELPYIFNRFYRADKSRTKQTGGTGLGLAIAKWIILKHKGTIEVESKINEGTKIILFLPIDNPKGFHNFP